MKVISHPGLGPSRCNSTQFFNLEVHFASRLKLKTEEAFQIRGETSPRSQDQDQWLELNPSAMIAKDERTDVLSV